MKFRTLRADEIECRVSTVSENGLSLLLYKDARCDMNILDETIGAENWQRSHELIDGQLFCNIGVRVERPNGFGEWVWKQDVGTESYTEKEKGRASDSFKRACFNLGIGRELYTAPFIWIPAGKCKLIEGKNGKLTCYDRFTVEKISYDERRRICELYITNTKLRKNAFSYGKPIKQGESVNIAQWKVLEGLCKQAGINLDSWLEKSGLTRESAEGDWIAEAIAAVKHRLDK